MRIGDTIIRIKGSFSDSVVGSIHVINAMKVYNGTVVLNLKGYKPDTFHGMSDFRNIHDVDVPCLQAQIAHVAERMREAVNKGKETKRIAKAPENESILEDYPDLIGSNPAFPDDEEIL